MNRSTLQAERTAAARERIGWRCRWTGAAPEGVITDVVAASGGWPKYVIDWDDTAPTAWASQVSTAARQLIVWEGK